MSRRGLWALALAASGCAGSTPPPSQAVLEAECRRDMSHDPSCIELLTGGDEYESRREVMEKEEEREADAFHSRLERMRRDEEARQLARSSTIARAGEEDEDSLLRLSKEAKPPADELDSASSVRALRPATLAAVLAQPPAPPATEPAPKTESFPTPELYLRGCACLLEADVTYLRGVLDREKKQAAKSKNSYDLGTLALAIVDAGTLADHARSELRHRGLPEGDGATCATQPVREVVELLRPLVGPAAERSGASAPYARGLVRLREELEVRAGLPKPR